MASNVFANSLAVATSTTGHVAHVLPPGDIRLVPPTPTPTPFWNQVGSSKIYAGAPMNTKFQSGKIWVEGTMAGPTSEPMITFPGQVSGGVSEFATSKEGSGSKNVFVESRKVYCFTHQTWQNRRNSQGMINDAPGAAKAKAEFDEEQEKNRKLITPDAGSGSEGEGDGDDGKPAETETPPEEPTEAPPPEEKCEVTGVFLTDQNNSLKVGKNRTRRQNVAAKDAKDAKIEVVGGSRVELEATFGTAICEQHTAQWTDGGSWSATGEKVSYSTQTISIAGAVAGATIGSIGGAPGMFLGGYIGAVGSGKTTGAPAVVTAIRLAFVTPRTHTIQCITCTQQFTRQVYAFPDRKAEAKLELDGMRRWGEAATALFRRIFRTDRGKIEIGNAEFGVEASWKEQSNWQCKYVLEIGGSVTLLKGEISFKKSFFNLPIPIPPAEAVKRVIQAINWVYEQLTGGKLIDIYLQLKFEADVTAGLSIEGKKAYQGGWEWDTAKFSLGGSVKVTLSVGIAALTTSDGDALAKAEGFASASAGVKGEVALANPPRLGGEFTYGPINLGIKLSYNLLVLFPGEVNEGEGNWFSRSYAWVRNRGSQLTRAAAERALKSMADMTLTGSKTYSIDVFEKRTVEFEERNLW